MNDAAKVAKYNARAANNALWVDALKSTAGGVKDITVAMLANPVISMVGAAALIEYLQTVNIKTGRQVEAYSGQSHVKVMVPETRPLISQAFATTLETTIITTQALGAIGNSGLLGGVVGLLGGGK